jgi:hypothetical protein
MDDLLAHDHLTFDFSSRSQILTPDGVPVGTLERGSITRIRGRDRAIYGRERVFCGLEGPTWLLRQDGAVVLVDGATVVGRVIGSQIRLGRDPSNQVVAAHIRRQPTRRGRRLGFAAVWHVDEASSGETVASICQQRRWQRGGRPWDVDFHRPVDEPLRVLVIAAVVVVEDQWRTAD